MSLTHFISLAANRQRLKPLRPQQAQFPRKIPVSIRAPARTKQYTIVATAFDYLLRIEIQRRAPWAIDTGWTADHATRLHMSSDDTREKLKERFTDDPVEMQYRIWARAERYAVEGRRFAKAFCQIAAPSADEMRQLAFHALRLAHVDILYRAGLAMIDREFFNEPPPDDIDGLLELLAIAPLDKFTNGRPLVLNPDFGESSRSIGGADVDLIVGQMMLDIKTTTATSCKSIWLDQLFGYFLLARIERDRLNTFPEISSAGIYFARHGHLLLFDTTVWTTHPDFAAAESWFRTSDYCKPIPNTVTITTTVCDGLPS